ncbi:hypothetical protein IVA95_27915 [Bradyrhizobium sp. 157]|uniref:hypothetical protein n=1 Tax=Bradyrhizobium sp. 157 TaxID=2782631 RepID=UPI001FFB4FFD|nr:hypothetical protein [Bradyrhizobium sp. 157]MCK1641301.1 hypothetical protein [Bradyrhizobium sp. 157]
MQRVFLASYEVVVEATANSVAVSRTYAAELIFSPFGPLTSCRMMRERRPPLS